MELKEQVYSVLLVSYAEKFNNSVIGLLPQSRYRPVHVVRDINSARRELLEKNYDIVLINSPLPDDSGIKFAVDLSLNSNIGILLLLKSENYAELSNKTADYGILTLSKPISAPLLLQTMHLLCGTRERLRRMEKKTATIEDKMQEIRLVNRAKWILIDELKMSEADAHRYIEKQAMDRCISKKQVAENIIKTYK